MNPDELNYENDYLLDVFASTALQELLKDDLAKPIEKQMGYDWATKYAYIIAESMMEARRAHHTAKTA